MASKCITAPTRQTDTGISQPRQTVNLLVTGGSDFHGVTKPDIEVGIGKGTLHVPDTLLRKLKHAAGRL